MNFTKEEAMQMSWVAHNHPEEFEEWKRELIAEKKERKKLWRYINSPCEETGEYPFDRPRTVKLKFRRDEWEQSVQKWLGGDICRTDNWLG